MGGAVRVSGAVVRDQHKVMEETFGAAVVARAVEGLEPDTRREYEAVLPVSWCSVDTANAVIRAVARELGRTPSDLQRQVARLGVERTLSTVWRLLLRVTSDDALVRRTPVIYGKTYDRGEFTSRIVAPGRAELTLAGWPAMPELDMESLGVAVETVLELAGRRAVRVTWERRSSGAFYVATWS